MIAEIQDPQAQTSVAALLNASINALEAGDIRESLAALLEAFTLAPDNIAVQEALIDLLGISGGVVLPKVITDRLADSALQNGLDIQPLATLLANQFEANEDVAKLNALLDRTEPGALHEVTEVDLDKICSDQLLLLICTKATSVSPLIEHMLVALRRHFLGEWLADTGSTSLLLDDYPLMLAAIATQAYNTEFVFDVSDDEQQKLERLLESVLEDLRSAHPFDLMILASYQPLWETFRNCAPEDLQYLADQAQRWPAWAQLIWKVQFLAPFQEQLIAQHIPFLSPIETDHSKAIAQQYESFPYPRWQSARATQSPVTLKDHMASRFPHLDISGLPDGPIQTLFAGCGTGDQVVRMGSQIAAENTLAVDLSMRSLSYANRKTKELGVSNIHFGQADILGIPEWDVSFDLIVCTGVLHHMQDIDKGFEALKAASKPETVFFLGLYSERARAAVSAAQELIAAHQLEGTTNDIRRFRKILRELPENHPAKEITQSREFYSISGLHDLVFNIHETRYSPASIKDFLERHELEFIGFDIRRADLLNAYKLSFPDDTSLTNLDNWEKFEAENPDLFGNMMQFWCRAQRVS